MANLQVEFSGCHTRAVKLFRFCGSYLLTHFSPMLLHFLARPLCRTISEPLHQHKILESSLAQGAGSRIQMQRTSVQKIVVLESRYACVFPENPIKTNNKTQSQINEIPNKEIREKNKKNPHNPNSHIYTHINRSQGGYHQ